MFVCDVCGKSCGNFGGLRTHVIARHGKGFKRTEEQRKQMSERLMGHKTSDEIKVKISASLVGRMYGPHTEERKRKIGDGNRGKVVSAETRELISKANTGKKRTAIQKSMMGKHRVGTNHSEETKEKMSDSRKKLCEDPHFRKQISKMNLKTWSDPEYRKRMKKMWKEKWIDPDYAKRRFATLRTIRPTKPELMMEELLNEFFPNEYKYVGDGDIWISGKNPDFININGQKKIIEVFGDYWHRNDNPQDRVDIFTPYGYQTLVIWEEDLYKDISFVIRKLQRFHERKLTA